MSERYDIHTKEVDLAAYCVEQLREGAIVCVPTDTVYGFICDPSQAGTVQRLYELKRRPARKPFALFVTVEKAGLRSPLLQPNESAHVLAKTFWPGALTLVIPASDEHLCANAGKAGLRSPDYSLLQSILRHFDEGLINTSLNLSGEPPVTSLRGKDALLEQVDLVIDGGDLPISEPSTVVDCSITPPQILRHGAIEGSEIFAALG